MSWFYRYFKKSNDGNTVTVTAPAINLVGTIGLTGALSQTGNVVITGNEYVSGTTRVVTSPIYFGSGSVGIGYVATTTNPMSPGVEINLDINSVLVGGTSGFYVRTGYASTSWASVDRYD